MDIFRFSADMLPKLSLLFSGYYVTLNPKIHYHLDAGLARSLALERTPTRNRAAMKFCGSRNHAARLRTIFVRAARRNFSENFAILSRELGAKFA